MARYLAQYRFAPQNAEPIFYEIKNYLEYEGFEYVNYKGEYVFQKGEGWLVAPTFVKVSMNGDVLQLEAWLKCAIFPGVFVGEYGLKGFYGWAVKGAMKRVVANIPSIVAKYANTQTFPQTQYPQYPQGIPQTQYPQYPQGTPNPTYPQYPQDPQNR